MVIPLERAEEALRKSDERAAKEAATMDRIRAGESIFDMYGYQAVLDRHGWTEE
jgi:4-hydroxy-4-methyl-2-oxoglutarate aldolase